MSHSLDRLTIKGFKSIRSLENFKLKRLNVMIGGNGAGKSNFIQFFKLLNAMLKNGGLQEFVKPNSDLYLFGGPKVTKEIIIKMSFGQNGYDFILAPTEDGSFLINNEERHYYPHETTRDLGSGHLTPALLQDKNNKSHRGDGHGASWYAYEAINSWQIYHFHDTTKTAGMRRFSDLEYNEKLLMMLPILRHSYWGYKKIIKIIMIKL